jgi:hypothetical protein
MDLLTARDAAVILGITPRQVTRLAKQGALPVAHKNPAITGSYLFLREHVEQLAGKRGAA